MTNCTRNCMPDNENIAPEASHYLDCIVWDFLGLRKGYESTRRAVGPAQVRGVTTTGQRRAAGGYRARLASLIAAPGVGMGIATATLGALLLVLFGAYVDWWN
jgi:hypothetical protein